MSKEKNNEKSTSDLSKNALEWSVFAVSLLLVGAVLLYLGREILATKEAPPHIVLQWDKPQPLQKSHDEEPAFMVAVKASNKGGQTAEGVHLEVEMQRGQEKPQIADFDIDFLPRGSSREGYVAFKGVPDNVKLKARVLGYQIP